MSLDDITAGIIEDVRTTLGITVEVEPASLMFYELDFSSMDLLDLFFLIEERFEVQLSYNDALLAQLVGDGDASDCVIDGYLTDAARERLIGLLPDTPANLFPARVPAASLYRLCTVGALARLVEHEISQAGCHV